MVHKVFVEMEVDVQFVYIFIKVLFKENALFTNDGPHQGYISDNDEIVRISVLGPVTINELSNGDYEINTGSPHYIQFKSSLEKLDFITYCKSIRNSSHYKNVGINVNLVRGENQNLFMRTYERGVENETLSCGSGVTAAALAFGMKNQILNKVHVNTPGGKLTVEFKKTKAFF